MEKASPISALPNELLLHILERVLLVAEGSPTAAINTLITLTAINSLWRNLVIGYAPFWTHIYVNLNQPPSPMASSYNYLLPGDLGRLSAFLARSRQCRIKLDLTRIYYSISGDEIQGIVRYWRTVHQLLEPHLRRCSSISFNFRDTRDLASANIFQLMESSNFPVLREVNIKDIYPSPAYNWDGTWGGDWKVSPQCTPLQVLRFHDLFRETYLPKALDVPWPYLSSLELRVSRAFWPDVCNTLAKNPMLQVLSLELLSSYPHTYQLQERRQERVHLNALEKISTNNLTIWHDILTPALNSLSITYMGEYEPLGTDRNGVARPVLHRAGSDRHSAEVAEMLDLIAELPIREITFADGSFSAWVVPLVLGITPHVHTLHLLRGYDHDDIIRLLCLQREHELQNPVHAKLPFSWAEVCTEVSSMILPELKTVVIDQSIHNWSTVPEMICAFEVVVDRLRALSVDVKWTLHGCKK
ncbi:hypothetical protein DL93DRAFT_2167454 [Clavulina sp. PMI_390]|nr:hypothetical protein DL93DRAFT_2167454 [Clavulina sp. PMI_390]